MNIRLHVRATEVCDYDERQVHVNPSDVTIPAMTIERNIRYGYKYTQLSTYLVDLFLDHHLHLR